MQSTPVLHLPAALRLEPPLTSCQHAAIINDCVLRELFATFQSHPGCRITTPNPQSTLDMHIFSNADLTPRHFDSFFIYIRIVVTVTVTDYDYSYGPTKPFSFHTLLVPTQWTNIRVALSKPSPHGIETWPLLHLISGFPNYEILQVLQVTNNPTFFRAPIRSATSHSTITSTSTTTREEEKLRAKYKCTMYHVPCTM
jgi:hypothetical protein